MAWYLAFIAAVGIVHHVVGASRPWLAGVIGVVTSAAIVTGVRVHRPARPLPWLLLAGGILANAAARVIFTTQHTIGPFDAHASRAVPIYALHVCMLVLVVAGLISLSRPPPEGRRLLTLVDGAVLIVGTGLLAWVAVAAPWTSGPTLDTVQVVVRISYVSRDVLLLAAIARLVSTVRWNLSVAWLALGILILLAYDAFVRIGLVHGEGMPGNGIEMLWVLFYASFGAAALVPAMARITATPGRRDGLLPLILVAGSAVIPFVLLLAGTAEHSLNSPAPVAVAAAAMLLLVLFRMTIAAVRLRRALSETRVVAEASAELVAAADLPAIEAAVTAAAGRLLGPHTDVTAHLSGSPPRGDRPGRLEIPLSEPGSTAAGAATGTLIVRAPPSRLATVRRPLATVAAQASLAVARIRLNDQVLNTRRDAYFRALVQNSTNVILILDDDARIRYASPSAAALFGTSAVEGRALPRLIAPQDRDAATQLLAGICREPAGSGSGTVRADWRTGRAADRWAEVSCLDLRAEDAVRGVVVTLRDVTDRRRLEDRLTEQAYHDPLTGLGNRSLFTEGVQRAVDTPHDEVFAGVLFIDLDDFKVINDGYGHVLGDAFLQTVASRIRSAAYPYGIAARIGGDEFAVLVEHAQLVDIDGVAERVVTSLGRPAEVQGELVRCGASVGVATTADAGTSGELLRHADLALYEAKGSGKQRWRRFDPTMHNAVVERLELRTALADALGTGALRLEFQPIVALDSGATVGFEALLRWKHPTRGRLEPSEFIELAEDSGLIGVIGEWVLDSSIEEAVRWAAVTPGEPPFVSVNVSPRQFQSPEMFDMVHRRLAECGLPPDRLMLEITENLLLADDEDVTRGLARLRQAGVRVAIDDFGTGYSGLGYLQRVPLDVVKLDRLFTRGMAASAQQRDLVAGIIQLASTLGLGVIAEGVETEVEHALVRAAGCVYGQGFVFSRPLPPEAAVRWAASHGRVPVPAGRAD